MNYIIQTPSAARLKKEILDSVEAKADANGKGIVTWQVAEQTQEKRCWYIPETNGQRKEE